MAHMETNNIAEILARNGLDESELQVAVNHVSRCPQRPTLRAVLETVARLLDKHLDIPGGNDTALEDARAILAEVLR